MQVLENGVALGPALRIASLADGQSLKTVSNQTIKVHSSTHGWQISSNVKVAT